MSKWTQLNANSEETYLYVLKSSSLSLNPLLRSILIPWRANSASLMGSVFGSSTLPGVAFAGAAIEALFTAGEGEKEGGVRSVQLPYLSVQPSQPVAQLFWANVAIFKYNFMPKHEWTSFLEDVLVCITNVVPYSAAWLPVFSFLLFAKQTPETWSISNYRNFSIYSNLLSTQYILYVLHISEISVSSLNRQLLDV